MTLLPAADSHDVAVEGVRFRLYRAGPGNTPGPGQPGRAGQREPAPVLLLHGVPQTAGMWRFLLPPLARDRAVLAPDLIGLGGSEVAGPYDVPTLTRQLAALVLHEVDGPVAVVGHDWGGVLALALARSRPELVDRLVVIAAPDRRIDYRRAGHIPAFAVPLAPEVAFALGGRDLLRRMIRYGWRADAGPDRDAVEQYASAYDDPARIAAMLGYYRAAVRRRLGGSVRRLGSGGFRHRPARAVSVPALVLWGAADPVLPVAVGEAVVHALGAGAEFVVLPGVGHFVPEEAPAETVEAVVAFLERAPAQPPPAAPARTASGTEG